MEHHIAMALDPSLILRAQGIIVDPWQRELLLSKDRQLLLNCCRQAGKSTTVSALALHEALFNPGATILILSPGQRQSSELFRKVLHGYNVIGRPVRASYETQLKLELENKSRLICLPGREETVRCYSPSLLIIDEASRVDENLQRLCAGPVRAVLRAQAVGLGNAAPVPGPVRAVRRQNRW